MSTNLGTALVRLDDRELILWAFIYDGARWEHATKELCFRGMRYSLPVDAIGLPDLTGHLRSKILAAFNTWRGEDA